MLIQVTHEQRALNEQNMPWLLPDEDEDAGSASPRDDTIGWSSPRHWRCPSCASAFRWPRRPTDLTGCPLCLEPVEAPPPPEVEEIRAWPVDETPPGARRIGPASKGTPGVPS
jgi:hypothetical protein